MHICKESIIFEVSNNQDNTTFSWTKLIIIRISKYKQSFLLVEPSKKVEVGFTSTEVSSFGGLAAIMSQKQNVRFLYEFAKRINDWRNPDFVEHTLVEMVTQRVLQIASGYEDADDCDPCIHHWDPQVGGSSVSQSFWPL